jgi:hypothetical protein
MSSNRRYVVAKYTNSGIGDHLTCVIGAWWYARQTGRTLIIDWRGSRFSCEPAKNVFSDYFEPIENAAGVPVIADDRVASLTFPLPIYPNKWNSDNLGSPVHQPHTADEVRTIIEMVNSGRDQSAPTVAINQHISPLPEKRLLRPLLDCLRFRKSVTERADAFADRYLAGRKVFGIHVRHGNGENIGTRAAYWLGPMKLVRQIRLNNATNIHRRDGVDAAADACDRFKDKMAPSLIDPNRHSATAKSLFRQIARQYDAFRRRYNGQRTAALLCADAQCVVDAIRNHIPDLVAYDKTMLPQGSGPLHQIAGDRTDQTASVQANFVHDMFVELALLRRVDGIVCMPSEFSILTRLELDDDAICILKPPLANRIAMKLGRRF